MKMASELSIHTFDSNCIHLRCSWVLLLLVAVVLGCVPIGRSEEDSVCFMGDYFAN